MDEEFEDWINALDRTERTRIMMHVGLLQDLFRTTIGPSCRPSSLTPSKLGPNLGRPYADSLKSSKHPHLKELRIQIAGDPWRVLFAFDTARVAILLVGGNKGGDKHWYKTHIPIANMRFERHLGGAAR